MATVRLSEESAPQFTPGPLKVVMNGTLTGIWAEVRQECVDPVTGKPWDRELLRSETTHVRRDEAYEGSWKDFAEAPEQYELTDDGEEAIANAHLWAAAPALYHALVEARAELEEEYAERTGEDYNNPRINAALSSARGEQGK